MGAKTKIEWAEATWNPVTGCTKISTGCTHCYMFREYPRLAAMKVKGYEEGSPDKVREWPDRIPDPIHWSRPRRIFVNSMSDLFHQEISHEFIGEVFNTMEACPRHTFIIVTKRVEEMTRFLFSRYRGQALPAHIWLLASVENQKYADYRIPFLFQLRNFMEVTVVGVSYEPALGPVDEAIDRHGQLDWVIAGGESGPNARPSNPVWFRSVRDRCVTARIPFFFKQWGEWVSVSEVAGSGEPFSFEDGRSVRRIGRIAAGRKLDGREWNEFPDVTKIVKGIY